MCPLFVRSDFLMNILIWIVEQFSRIGRIMLAASLSPAPLVRTPLGFDGEFR